MINIRMIMVIMVLHPVKDDDDIDDDIDDDH